MADVTASEKKRRMTVGLLLALAAGAGIFIVTLMFFSPGAKTPASKTDLTKGSGVADRPVAVGRAGTPEYNKNIIKFDEKKAQEALVGGKSFMPTPIGSSSVIKKTPAPGNQPAANGTQKNPSVTPQTYGQGKTKDPNSDLLKRIMEDMASLEGRMGGSAGPKLEFSAKPESPGGEIRKADARVPASLPAGPETPAPGIKAGDILYSVVTTAVNSDVPAPVTASVLSGPFRKSRLIGGFQRFDERLVVAFNRLVRPDGTEIGIEGYAIDPETTEASVASNVNTHFFSRWGGLIAASFLEGLGEAKRYSGASSYVYPSGDGGSDQMVWGNYSVADQAWIAAGKVGQRSGRIMEKNFERVPTVYLEAGTQIGVLISNSKR
jgi:type IV secretory pathway VirB10-like protein